MSPEGAGQSGSDAGATARAARQAEDDAAAQQGYLVGGVFIATFVFIAIVVMTASRPAEVTLTASSFAVRGGGYSAEVPRAAIDSVQLVPGLDGLGAKRNGFQWGSVYAGLFEMRPFGKARLFVDASRPPYVRLFTRDGVILVNGKSVTETQQLYSALQRAEAAQVIP